MASSTSATSLPPRLMNFFARYPPSIYSAKAGKVAAPAVTKPSKANASQTSASSRSSSSASSSNAAENTTSSSIPPPPSPAAAAELLSNAHYNPFLPWKNPITGHWRAPAYSLRRQADLVKLAKAHGIEQLLPPGKKSTEFKEQRILHRGLRVQGTGEGFKVKGHKWERMKSIKLDERKKAMEGMPELIRLWKQRGHGKWWKKYPR